jgi:predicted DNA-binding transcriptional regulator AlpA
MGTKRAGRARRTKKTRVPTPVRANSSAAVALISDAALQASTRAVAPATTDPDGFITQLQARALLGGVTDTTIERWRKDLGFPRPAKFGGHRNFYRRRDVLDWAARRLSEQPSANAA